MNEIFISYAHEDDRTLFGEEAGWVTAFHRSLEVYLGQLVGKGHKPKIWRDPRLHRNRPFADELAARIANAAALVCVLSPCYRDSEWCQKELTQFLDAARGEGGKGAVTGGRLFKVVKIPVTLETLPGEMQRVRGYDFFKTDPDKDTPITIDPAIDSSLKRDYWAKLTDLVHDMSKLLQSRLREPAEPAGGGGTEESGTDRPAVYLADTISDLQRQHDEIKRDLQHHGYRVLPDQRLPLVAGRLAELVREQLEGCRLSIHLVGSQYGVVPEESEESVVALQNALAAERSRGGALTRLIWLPPGLETTDQRQRELIDALRRDDRNHVGADLLETTLEDLKTVIHQRLEGPASGAEPEPPPTDLTRVYLVCDQRDLESIAVIEQDLYSRGLEVIRQVFEGDEEQVRRDHEESLATCDAVLIYYGEGNELWLRRKLRELLKIAGYGRPRPLLAKAIYVAPPATPHKDRLRTHEARVLRPAGSVDPAALDPFLRDVENVRARDAG